MAAPWTRRDFLKTIGQAGILCCTSSLGRAAELLDSDTVGISILHTTDLHGHILPTFDYNGRPDLGGFARCMTQIRRWRRKNPNSILIDVGDVYQGTDVALRSKGELMIDLFNHFKYDAWVIGNHEFDWGIDPFARAVERSKMPVLAANTTFEGKPAGESSGSGPFAKIQPYILREFSGIKVAVIGITTPGMPFWFRPEFIRGMDFQYPVEPVRRAIIKAKGEGANAIVLAGHMGLKARTGGDDFANNVISLTTEFPDAAVFIAGHTHQAIPSRLTNNVILTQSDHYGIHAGRVDLVFDRNSKKLLHREASCELMDKRFRINHVTISRAQKYLSDSEIALAEPIGDLAETLGVRSKPGEPSDVERLIGAAIVESLQKREKIRIDGVFHGLFDDKHDFLAGPKTVKDVWDVLPYENYLVTADLTPEQIQAMMEEVYSAREPRSLLGIEIKTEMKGLDRKIVSMKFPAGRPLERAKKYVIALNTFDSRSAGHRFMKLRGLLERPEVNCTMHAVQTRDTLIEYFREHKVVHRITPQELRTAA